MKSLLVNMCCKKIKSPKIFWLISFFPFTHQLASMHEFTLRVSSSSTFIELNQGFLKFF